MGASVGVASALGPDPAKATHSKGRRPAPRTGGLPDLDSVPNRPARHPLAMVAATAAIPAAGQETRRCAMLDGRTGAAADTVVMGTAALALLAGGGPVATQQGGGASASTAGVPGRSTAGLATLCDTGLQGAGRADAAGYRHGFIVGVGQFHTFLTATGGAQRPIFRVPNPQPTLDQVAAAFVVRARANPRHAAERAVGPG